MRARFNGADADPALVGTRGQHYGDGVFRTVLVHGGAVVDAEGQWAHLARDASALGLVCDVDAVQAEAARLAAECGAGVLKVILSRRAGVRGYAPSTDQADRLLLVNPLPAFPDHPEHTGVEVAWSSILLALQPRLARIKHLNRLEQVLAASEIPDGAHEVLMCDAEGRVTCGTRTNVFFVMDGVLRTPDLSRAGVAGRMRHRVLELAGMAGIESYVETIAPDEVRHSEECFLTNSIIGIWPVRRVGGLALPVGPITTRLRAALAHPAEGAA